MLQALQVEDCLHPIHKASHANVQPVWLQPSACIFDRKRENRKEAFSEGDNHQRSPIESSLRAYIIYILFIHLYWYFFPFLSFCFLRMALETLPHKQLNDCWSGIDERSCITFAFNRSPKVLKTAHKHFWTEYSAHGCSTIWSLCMFYNNVHRPTHGYSFRMYWWASHRAITRF